MRKQTACSRRFTPGTSLLLDPAVTSVNLTGAINPAVSIIEDISIPARLKARKNNTEISCAEKCHGPRRSGTDEILLLVLRRDKVPAG
ncbi:MAG: hypothetical protein MZV63_37050 [Marinilabiliales bacterium]|nr:hypothetical protein [Marinilabiliales bacterium]